MPTCPPLPPEGPVPWEMARRRREEAEAEGCARPQCGSESQRPANAPASRRKQEGAGEHFPFPTRHPIPAQPKAGGWRTVTSLTPPQHQCLAPSAPSITSRANTERNKLLCKRGGFFLPFFFVVVVGFGVFYLFFFFFFPVLYKKKTRG